MEEKENNEVEENEVSEEASEDLRKEKISEDKGEQESNENKLEHIEKKQEGQIKWAVVLMLGLLVIVIAVPYFNAHFINSFEYGGLEFQKTQLGDLRFYSTKFPVVGVTGNVIGNYAVNLREDPRELDDEVFLDLPEGIQFAIDQTQYGPAYISLNPFMEVCDDSGIALMELAGFLRDSGLNVHSAYTDKAYARDNNVTQRWCDTSGFDTVIVVTDGTENSITQIQSNCYEIQFKDCEILKPTEKFILIMLEEYASRFEE